MTTTDTPPDARGLVRVLMRGNRRTQRPGDTGPTAVLVACERFAINDTTADQALELLAYAYGYAVGLNDDWLNVDHLCESHAELVREGYQAGLAEPATETFPSPVGTETMWDGGIQDR